MKRKIFILAMLTVCMGFMPAPKKSVIECGFAQSGSDGKKPESQKQGNGLGEELQLSSPISYLLIWD